MNKSLKLDSERIDFLIDMLVHYKPKNNSDNYSDSDLFVCKEILTDLRIMEIEDDEQEYSKK